MTSVESRRDQTTLGPVRKDAEADDPVDLKSPHDTTGQWNGPQSAQKRPAFEPKDRTNLKAPRIALPDELWLSILQCPCTFPSDIFHTVMLNLVKNPNITSSHLFRADIFYDSEQDHLFHPEDSKPPLGLAAHLKAELQPITIQWPGCQLERTIVRQLVPRNPQLDKPLVQTCHFFRGQDDDGGEHTLVVYIPHTQYPDDMPFYHPTVSQLAFLHTSHQYSSSQQSDLTLLYRPFPSHPVSTKLERTALKLLQTIHKHGQGALSGYEKRVHLDQILPQKSYQDTYSRLKTKYGKQLAQQWVEVTDPGKHVFEDIAIAAYLVELWKTMYARDEFPGFVDIGCGNGILVYILLSEGYVGWGFDARRRKTWDIFPPEIQKHLQQRILVPSVFEAEHEEAWHNGELPPGTFIISNHADELTPWTPLLAYLNSSAFIAIPCCSHDLSGARARAPIASKMSKRLPQQPQQEGIRIDGMGNKQAAETGSLQRTEAQKKVPSAYSTLCSYVTSLATDVGFRPEQDVLRIPSTRNACIVGRNHDRQEETIAERRIFVTEIVEQELKRPITSIASDWIGQAQKLMKKLSSGH